MEHDPKKKIADFYQARRRMPSYSEMMKLFGYKSKNAVYRLVNKLVDAGMVSKDALGHLIPQKLLGEIPKLGLVTAGFPAPVEEQTLETISLDDLLVPRKESRYMLEVDGDSMIDAHIADGDLVIAERSNHAKDGQIVIAQVDGEFTMKYFREKNGKTWLEPANKAYKPIYPEHELVVAAIVTSVIRQY